MSFKVIFRSPLGANRTTVWKHMTRMEGVNSELMPLMYMTHPAEASDLAQMPPGLLGETLFGSVLLLFGFLPMDVHFLQLDSVQHEVGFQENSSSLINKTWKHHRTIFEGPKGTVELEDEVSFTPRLWLLGWLLRPVVWLIFAHRHRRLRARFPLIQ